MSVSIKPIKFYRTDGEPTLEDITFACNEATILNCYITVDYYMFGYPYCIHIKPNDSAEELYNGMPKTYGL